jgi:protein TonB
MKTTHSIIAALCLAAVPSLAHAKTLEQSYIDAARKSPAIPVPISVVAPEVEARAAGESVTANFVVDQTGRPSAITASGADDPSLRAAVVDAVGRWRFRPARVNGAAVAMAVVVPFHFVRGAGPEPFVPDFVRKGSGKG